LVVDDFGAGDLKQKFRSFPYACGIIENELSYLGDGRIDLERLMTRLELLMPTDLTEGARDLLKHLSVELKLKFLDRLRECDYSSARVDGLKRFAKLCVEQSVACITFNYDSVLDQALRSRDIVTGPITNPFHWNPGRGYGFSCKPASVVTDQGNKISIDKFLTRLKKLQIKKH